MLLIPAAGMAALVVAAPASAKHGGGGAGGKTPPAKQAPAPPPCANADAVATSLTTAQLRDALLCLVNAQRRARKVPQLTAEPHLGRAAQDFAGTLTPPRKLNDRGRDGSTPQSRAAAAGYAGGKAANAFVGEVLGRSIGTSATPSARVNDWLGTAATRKLLMSPRFHDAGFGAATTRQTTTFVVALGVVTG